MNIKSYKNYIKISKSIASKFYSLHKETYIRNSISELDLISIATLEMLKVLSMFSTKISNSHKKVNKSLPNIEACIRTGVSGKMLNVINRECVKHNKILIFNPNCEDLAEKVDINVHKILSGIDLANNIENIKIGEERDIIFFEIKDLKRCLNRKEYKIVSLLYVKNLKFPEIAKEMNISKYFTLKIYKSSVQKIKKYLVAKNVIPTV